MGARWASGAGGGAGALRALARSLLCLKCQLVSAYKGASHLCTGRKCCARVVTLRENEALQGRSTSSDGKARRVEILPRIGCVPAPFIFDVETCDRLRLNCCALRGKIALQLGTLRCSPHVRSCLVREPKGPRISRLDFDELCDMMILDIGHWTRSGIPAPGCVFFRVGLLLSCRPPQSVVVLIIRVGGGGVKCRFLATYPQRRISP